MCVHVRPHSTRMFHKHATRCIHGKGLNFSNKAITLARYTNCSPSHPFITLFTDLKRFPFIMKSFLPISSISSFPVIFLSSSTALAKPLPQAANPQLDFSSEPDSYTSSLSTTNLDFLLPQRDQQQPFPLDTTTSNSNTFLSADNNNNQPAAAGSSHHCNSLPHLHPRSDDDSTSSKSDMCPMDTEEIPYPAPNWDPTEEWAEYLREHPPDGTLVRPEDEAEEYRAPRDESVGTGCPDPFHQDHLCCAGPAGKTGVFNSRPNDISYIQHCAACM